MFINEGGKQDEAGRQLEILHSREINIHSSFLNMEAIFFTWTDISSSLV